MKAGIEKKIIFISLIFVYTCFLYQSSIGKLTNKLNENERLYGEELITKAYTEEKRNFSGKKIYQLPHFGWQVEVLYIDGKSFSESARPRGDKFKKGIITESEANVISDVLFPKKELGPYRKKIINANFISHFFEHGVVSYEMQLDKKRKNHIGIIGVRTVLYNEGATFKDVMVNAYH